MFLWCLHELVYLTLWTSSSLCAFGPLVIQLNYFELYVCQVQLCDSLLLIPPLYFSKPVAWEIMISWHIVVWLESVGFRSEKLRLVITRWPYISANTWTRNAYVVLYANAHTCSYIESWHFLPCPWKLKKSVWKISSSSFHAVWMCVCENVCLWICVLLCDWCITWQISMCDIPFLCWICYS